MSAPPPIDIPGLEDYELIGRGGFSSVYRARQPRLNRVVAVKVLDLRADVDTAKVFDRECRAAGALGSHPHVVDIHDSGVDPRGVPWIVMPYYSAGAIDRWVAESGPLPWRVALDIGRKIASALAKAHARGIVHRDVKPENILLSDYGEPLLTDFGIARVASTSSSQTSVALTVLHAGPEVIEGKPPQPSSDVYSLGSTLYTLIAGHAPHHREGESGFGAIVIRVLQNPPPDLRPGCPGPVWRLVESMLAKDPARRPTAEQVARQAERLLETAPALLEAEPAHLALPAGASDPRATIVARRAEPWARFAPPDAEPDAEPDADLPDDGVPDGGDGAPDELTFVATETTVVPAGTDDRPRRRWWPRRGDG